MVKTGVDYNKKLVVKSAAKLKSTKITFKQNPEWNKQFKVVLKEAKKLDKIDLFLIIK